MVVQERKVPQRKSSSFHSSLFESCWAARAAPLIAVSVPDYAVMESIRNHCASFLNLSSPFIPWFQAKEKMVIWKRKGGGGGGRMQSCSFPLKSQLFICHSHSTSCLFQRSISSCPVCEEKNLLWGNFLPRLRSTFLSSLQTGWLLLKAGIPG